MRAAVCVEMAYVDLEVPISLGGQVGVGGIHGLVRLVAKFGNIVGELLGCPPTPQFEWCRCPIHHAAPRCVALLSVFIGLGDPALRKREAGVNVYLFHLSHGY